MSDSLNSSYSAEDGSTLDPSGDGPRESGTFLGRVWGRLRAIFSPGGRDDRHRFLRDLLKSQHLAILETFDTAAGGKVVVSFPNRVDAATVEAAVAEVLDEIRGRRPPKPHAGFAAAETDGPMVGPAGLTGSRVEHLES